MKNNQGLILKVVPVPELGQMILKPGAKLFNSFFEDLKDQRVLIMPVPVLLSNSKSGLIDFTPVTTHKNELTLKMDLVRYFCKPEVLPLFGSDFGLFVERIPMCQAFDGEYCDKNLTTTDFKIGKARLCWHHDNQYRNTGCLSSERIKELEKRAIKNFFEFCIERIKNHLRLEQSYPLNYSDVLWWSIKNKTYEYLPGSFLESAFNRKPVKEKNGHNTRVLALDNQECERKSLKNLVKLLDIDDEPPAMFMARPKELNWRCEKYLKFIRSLPCVVTGRTGSDYDQVVAHHLIGHGEGKMGGKAHDLFTFPMLSSEHQKFHHDPKAWEEEHGTQLYYVKDTIKTALDLGAIQ
jgi:hypothetical protein